jgi:ribosomal protein S25
MSRTIEETRRARRGRERKLGRPTAAVSERHRARAIALITADPSITRSALAYRLDVDPDSARRIRRQLEEAGLVPDPPAPVEVTRVELGRLEVDRAIAITGADSPRAALEQLVRERDVLVDSGSTALEIAGRAAADKAARRRVRR